MADVPVVGRAGVGVAGGGVSVGVVGGGPAYPGRGIPYGTSTAPPFSLYSTYSPLSIISWYLSLTSAALVAPVQKGGGGAGATGLGGFVAITGGLNVPTRTIFYIYIIMIGRGC